MKENNNRNDEKLQVVLVIDISKSNYQYILKSL